MIKDEEKEKAMRQEIEIEIEKEKKYEKLKQINIPTPEKYSQLIDLIDKNSKIETLIEKIGSEKLLNKMFNIVFLNGTDEIIENKLNLKKSEVEKIREFATKKLSLKYYGCHCNKFKNVHHFTGICNNPYRKSSYAWFDPNI